MIDGRWMRKNIVFGAALFVLAGCAGRQTEEFVGNDLGNPNDFNSCLAQTYQAGAQSKIDRGNWDAANWLARKGVAASRDKRLDPATGTSRGVDSSMSYDFLSAREKLVNATAQYGRTRPCACGQAQGLYDVWLVEETSNVWGSNSEPASKMITSDAKNNFMASLDECKTGRVRVAGRQSVDDAMGSQEAQGIEGMEIIAEYTIYFDFNSSKLDANSDATLDDVADLVIDYDRYLVKITGHADTAGPAYYNVLLGHRRSKSVAQTLDEKGVSQTSTHSQGESNPAVPTGDDVREPLNRRAEIVIYAP